MARRIAQKATTQATRTSALAAAVRVPGFATAPKRAAKKASPHNDCTIELEVSATSNRRRTAKRQLGRFAGKLRYMAEDFDETPECFKECMCEGRNNMPTLSLFFGIVIRMFVDDHNPPHFHAEYQDYQGMFNLDGEMIEGDMPIKQRKLIESWAIIHREDLEANWKLAVAKEALFRIDPLR